VIADSAYPSQSNPGIETIVSDADQMDTVKQVLAAIARSSHVKPIIYTDKELAFVAESDAPGVSAFREELAAAVKGMDAHALPHEEIIAKLDQAAQLFNVLIIKTGMTIPYTSVFLCLDCAYWNAEAEARLRAAIR
jgi:D-ribose pyranose/furanose isomerase RbsD